jgi:hypothetical protein
MRRPTRSTAAIRPPSAPGAGWEHELDVLSRHRTSEGVVTYARCTCGELQIWLAAAGRPAHTLITSIRGPGRIASTDWRSPHEG